VIKKQCTYFCTVFTLTSLGSVLRYATEQPHNSAIPAKRPVSVSSTKPVPLLLDAISHLLAGKTLKTTDY